MKTIDTNLNLIKYSQFEVNFEFSGINLAQRSENFLVKYQYVL